MSPTKYLPGPFSASTANPSTAGRHRAARRAACDRSPSRRLFFISGPPKGFSLNAASSQLPGSSWHWAGAKQGRGAWDGCSRAGTRDSPHTAQGTRQPQHLQAHGHNGESLGRCSSLLVHTNHCTSPARSSSQFNHIGVLLKLNPTKYRHSDLADPMSKTNRTVALLWCSNALKLDQISSPDTESASHLPH